LKIPFGRILLMYKSFLKLLLMYTFQTVTSDDGTFDEPVEARYVRIVPVSSDEDEPKLNVGITACVHPKSTYTFTGLRRKCGCVVKWVIK